MLILRARGSDKKLDEHDKNSRGLLRVINGKRVAILFWNTAT